MTMAGVCACFCVVCSLDRSSMETLELGELLKDLSDGQISEDDIESAMQMLDADNSMTVGYEKLLMPAGVTLLSGGGRRVHGLVRAMVAHMIQRVTPCSFK